MKGLVCRVESKDYYVLDEKTGESIRCSIRGKIKKEFTLKKDKLISLNIAAVGDSVEYEKNPDGSGVIISIGERINYLSRKSPRIKGASFRGERLEQIVAANIDNFFIISSTCKPDFNNKVIDRFLVIGESAHVNSIIIINKSDLNQNKFDSAWLSLYRGIGYECFLTSSVNGEGIEKIRQLMQGKKNLFWGQSGVGKSSILNKLYQHLKLNVKDVSSYSNKGTHTTVTSVLLKVEPDTYVIDTPGVREIDPFGIRKEDLGHYFKEFADFIKNCRFNTCTHNHEPGCAVIDAVENNKISTERFDSYLRILNTIEEDIIFK
ncbi:MAG: ribosome small subunit-dependent GTPase A [Ignavibacteriaceae bacterium]|nr:ribosome small subunit-dependent GTPase A [Ignavibacteriaceae bacterium]